MDASEHEYPSMSRHNRRVPTSFYSRFSRDLNDFATCAAHYASRSTSPIQSKIVAVLEGGYSDRALMSATASFLTGLATNKPIEWDLAKDILPLGKVCSSAASGIGNKKPLPEYIVQTGSLFDLLTGQQRKRTEWQSNVQVEAVPAQAMRLRDRTQMKAPVQYAEQEDVKPAVNRARQKKVVATPMTLPAPVIETPENAEKKIEEDARIPLPTLAPAVNAPIPILPQPFAAPINVLSEASSSDIPPLRAGSPAREGSPKRNIVWAEKTYEGESIKQHSGPAIKLVWKSQGIN